MIDFLEKITKIHGKIKKNCFLKSASYLLFCSFIKKSIKKVLKNLHYFFFRLY